MRIVLDTNVLISATLWNGCSKRILERVENQKIDLLISEDILEEYVETMNYDEIKQKIKNKSLEINYSIDKIRLLSKIINIISKLNICTDPDNNKILECAVDGNVDYIITYDKHLLVLKEFNKIKIVTPEEF
jgi:putative PIN family toxin of toxin-antitoxin system